MQARRQGPGGVVSRSFARRERHKITAMQATCECLFPSLFDLLCRLCAPPEPEAFCHGGCCSRAAMIAQTCAESPRLPLRLGVRDVAVTRAWGAQALGSLRRGTCSVATRPALASVEQRLPWPEAAASRAQT